MNSDDLSREDFAAINRDTLRHAHYFVELLRRIDTQEFPPDDPLRLRVQAVCDTMRGLTGHTDQQASSTTRRRKRPR
jgi:hypothetical protein